jgi:hypothetical protein
MILYRGRSRYNFTDCDSTALVESVDLYPHAPVQLNGQLGGNVYKGVYTSTWQCLDSDTEVGVTFY